MSLRLKLNVDKTLALQHHVLFCYTLVELRYLFKCLTVIYSTRAYCAWLPIDKSDGKLNPKACPWIFFFQNNNFILSYF